MKVVVFGSGGHAKVALEILQITGYQVKGFLDDNIDRHGDNIKGIPIYGGREQLGAMKESGVTGVFIGIGNNKVRKDVADFIISEHGSFECVNAIHPKANIYDSAKLGKGLFIAPSVVIGVDSIIGDHAIINSGATVGHDAIIGKGADICPGVNIAGNVVVGDYTQVGIGSKVIQGLSLGKHSVIGAGSIVVRDIPNSVVAFGNPARIRRELDNIEITS